MRSPALLLLLLLIGVGFAAAAAQSPYSRATASTAKQDFSGDVLLCDVSLGYLTCGVASACRGNCTLSILMLVESMEMALDGTLFCLANLHVPHQQ